MAEDSFDLASYIGLLAPALNAVVIERLDERGFAGVKVSHGYVVQRLLNDDPTIGAIAEALGMTQQGASKQVSDLERLGYVERVPVAGDQRARAVRLTPHGRAMVDSARRIRAQMERAVLARVGERSVAETKKTLDALIDVVGLRERVDRRMVQFDR